MPEPIRSNGHQPLPPDLQRLLDQWRDRVGREAGDAAPRPPPEPAPERPPGRAPEAGGASIRGSCVVFADDPERPVVLQRVRGRLVHRGTIAVRGPAGSGAILRGLGLPEPAVMAAEFVAAWFGAPFDGVNLRSGRGLSWGVWHLAGAPLGDALAQFKEEAPLPFATTLARYGIDVAPAGAGARVVCRGPARALVGPAAEARIAGDPRLVASLARAARHEAARRAQWAAAKRHAVDPTLAALAARSRPGGSAGSSSVTPRMLAASLTCQLQGGMRGLSEMLEAAKRGFAGGEPGSGVQPEEAILQHALELERAGRKGDASRLQRVLGSVELGAA